MQSWRWMLVASLSGVALAAACSGDDVVATGATGPTTTTNAGGGNQGGGGATASGGGGTISFGGNTGCSDGDCGGGEVCAGDGSCCIEESLCGDGCCDSAEICSFNVCVTPGDECIDASECADDEYCDYSLGEDQGQGGADPMCSGGVLPPTGKCLPKPPECAPNQDPGDPPECVEKCEYFPPIGQFEPEEKFSWGDVNNNTHNVMMAPIVTQLDDDDCDGVVNERDLPDIVFFTFDNNDYNNTGGNSATLRAISIVDGVLIEKWSTKTADDAPGRSIAAADVIPNLLGNEIAVCTRDGRVRLYDALGQVVWTSLNTGTSCFMPSIADIDQDGTAEIIVRGAIIDGLTGDIEVTVANTQNIVVSDVDGDNQLDIVGTSRAYDATGALIADSGVLGTHPAVGDLDNDGIPEIVTAHHGSHTLSVWHVDANEPGGFKIFRQGLDMNEGLTNHCCAANPNSSGCNGGGGPPTIGDFNGDGFPDVALAGGIGYVIFDGQKLTDETVADVDTRVWLQTTKDCSSAQTGSSLFDFDGDGKTEVVYADEETLRIYDGTNGNELFTTCNTSGTLWEYPLVADVDNDGHADIIVASNHYSSLSCSGVQTTGIRVFGDVNGDWVRTRRIWNQHGYHVTNVAEDGSIPQQQPANHLTPGLNNFRQNVQPEGEFSAPDLRVEVQVVCAQTYELVGRVRNLGQASVPPGVVVGFYEGDPGAGGVKLGEATTTQTLYALGVEDVHFVPATMPSNLVYAVVDDGMPAHPWHECRTDNNVSPGVDPDCDVPQ